MSFKDTYKQFCLTNEVPLFFQPFWLDTCQHPWHVCFAEMEGHQAYFVYTLEKKLGHTFIRNPHLTPYTGFLFCQKPTAVGMQEKLIHLLMKQLPKYDVLDIDLPLAVHTNISIPSVSVSHRRTNLIALDDDDIVYNKFKPALKRQIKKATSKLTIYEDDNLELFYSLHQKTFLKQQTQPRIPFDVCEQYWNTCKKHDCGKLFFIRDTDQQIHAGVWMTYDSDTAYYLAGGTDAIFYGSGAMSGLIWHAIQTAIIMHKKTFDFEGSMLPAVDRFFKNFSPEEVHYLHLKKVNSLLYSLLKK